MSTLRFSLLIFNGLSASGRVDNQTCIREVTLGAPLSKPSFHEQSKCGDLRVRLIADSDIVMSVFKDITGNFSTTDDHRHRSISADLRKNISIGFPIHREVDHNSGRSISCILTRETLEPSH
jgi:hypothetical protein